MIALRRLSGDTAHLHTLRGNSAAKLQPQKKNRLFLNVVNELFRFPSKKFQINLQRVPCSSGFSQQLALWPYGNSDLNEEVQGFNGTCRSIPSSLYPKTAVLIFTRGSMKHGLSRVHQELRATSKPLSLSATPCSSSLPLSKCRSHWLNDLERRCQVVLIRRPEDLKKR